MWWLVIFAFLVNVKADLFLKQQDDELYCTVINSNSSVYWTNEGTFIPIGSYVKNVQQLPVKGLTKISSLRVGRLIPILPPVMDERMEYFKSTDPLYLDSYPNGQANVYSNDVDGILITRILWKNVHDISQILVNLKKDDPTSTPNYMTSDPRDCMNPKHKILLQWMKGHTKKSDLIHFCIKDEDYNTLGLTKYKMMFKVYAYEYYLYNTDTRVTVPLNITGNVNCIKLYVFMCFGCAFMFQLDNVNTTIFHNSTWKAIILCKNQPLTNLSVLNITTKSITRSFQFKFWALSSITLYNSLTYKKLLKHQLTNETKMTCNELETGKKLTWNPKQTINETCEDTCTICHENFCFRVSTENRNNFYHIILVVMLSLIGVVVSIIGVFTCFACAKNKAERRPEKKCVTKEENVENIYESVCESPSDRSDVYYFFHK